MTNLIYEILIFVFIALSSFFSGTETAITSTNRIKLKAISVKGNKRAMRALKILDNIEDALSMILIGNNISNITATALITFIATKAFLLNESALLIVTTIQTIIFLLLCEILPKIIARSKAESFIMFFSFPILIMMLILKPAVKLSLLFSKLLKEIFHLDSSKYSHLSSRDEIGLLFQLGESEGIIDKYHQMFLSEFLSFNEITANAVMTPTIDIKSIEKRQSIKQLVALIEKTKFSRIPIYDGRVDNIIGYVYYKDLLEKNNINSIEEIIKKAYYIPDTKKINELSQEMQEKKLHLAFVANEFGAVVGIVTFEDIAEEIVGEIQTRDHPDEELIKKINEKRYILHGSLDIDTFQRMFAIVIEKKGFETLAGFITYKMQTIPQKGEKIEYSGYTFIIAEATERSVEKVVIILPKQNNNRHYLLFW